MRAFVTLTLGLTLVVLVAARADRGAEGSRPAAERLHDPQQLLNTLAKTDYSTVLIALAAGVAAILSFETRASAAVGVAISVTTIPASAYLGVAIGGGGTDSALGALLVAAGQRSRCSESGGSFGGNDASSGSITECRRARDKNACTLRIYSRSCP